MLIYFIILCSSVDKSKYRQCKDSPFCLRNRFPSPQKWKAVPNNIYISEKSNCFQIPISSETLNSTILLNIKFILKSGIHIKFTNSSEEFGKKRFDSSTENSIVNQTIVRNSKTVQQIETENQTHITIIFENNENIFGNKNERVVIQIEPFSLYFYDLNGALKVSMNSEDLIFEQVLQNVESEFIETDVHKSVASSFIFHDKNVKFSGLPTHTLSLNLQSTIKSSNSRKSETSKKDVKSDVKGDMKGDVKGDVKYYEAINDPIRFFNTDINSFDVNSGMAMYGSIPYLVAHSRTESTSIFWCNPSDTWTDIENIEQKVRFVSETNFIDFFIFFGNHSSVIEEFSTLTGFAPLPQMFTFGYHQCRWTYYSSDQIREVTKNLDLKQIPHDVLWLDLDHTDEKKYFTFNDNYRDIAELTQEIVSQKRRLVAQVDPHLKAVDSYRVYKEAKDRDFLIKRRNNITFKGFCWPGESAWIDFLNPNAREWWSRQYSYDLYKGSSSFLFTWNDMNEPAVFETVDLTVPKDSLHFRGYEDRTVHNLYGHFMVMSTYRGLLRRNRGENERCFVLTRSFFAGSQKYALMWTGDNTASWEQLKASVIMTLSLGISNFPLSGSDVGGFFNSPDEDLLSRWYQLGAFVYPFYRCHCHHLSERREPYTLNGDFFERTKIAIQERYSLLPLFYTLMKENTLNGKPIVRPLWFEFQSSEKDIENNFKDIENNFKDVKNNTKDIEDNIEDIEDEVMIGDSLLIAPIVDKESSLKNERKIVFPLSSVDSEDNKIRWFDFRTHLEIKILNDNHKLIKTNLKVPIFIKGGKIIPKKNKIRKSSEAMFNDPFSLVVCLDKNMRSEGKLYVDDGHSYDYTRGSFIHRKFIFENGEMRNEEEKMFPKNLIGKNDTFYENYNGKIEEIDICGTEIKPKRIVNVKSGKEIVFIEDNGVIRIERANLDVKEDWLIKFEF